MEVTLVHYSLYGETERLGDRFKYDNTRIEGFSAEDSKIVIVARRFYPEDRSLRIVQRFIELNKKSIVGVILVDDKNYGEEYCDFLPVFSDHGVHILGTLDSIVSDEDIKNLEARIDEKI